MDAIWRTCGGGMDEIEDDVDRVANSTYISLMDETALAQMEAFLDVPPDGSRTLEERRKLVSSYFLGAGHIGAREIKEIAKAFTEGKCEVSFANSEVYIHIKADISDTPPADDFFFILRKKIPAHLGVNTEIEIEFTENLYVAANAMQNDRYIVGPEKLKKLGATGRIYSGAATMQSDRYTVLPYPQPGLSFGAEIFSAMAVMASSRTTIQPTEPKALSSKTGLYTGAGAIENARYQIDLIPGNTRFEAASAVRTGCGIVENTHYIVQSQGGI
nr:MAG TPA: tail protein [Caudoviricetes sp.]